MLKQKNWTTIIIAVLFIASLITAIVLTVKMKRKAFFVGSTFALIVILAISCGIGYGQRNEYKNYEDQANYFYLRTRITPHSLKKVKFNTFEKAVRDLHKRDQLIAKGFNMAVSNKLIVMGANGLSLTW
ncbi:MAG: hypothetical protein AJITA_00829 [Acetilactobacillus jinshanensis]